LAHFARFDEVLLKSNTRTSAKRRCHRAKRRETATTNELKMNTESTPPRNEDVLTLDEAASILKVSRRTMQTKIRKGEIRASKISRRIVRLFRSDINNFLLRKSTIK
jgi:excisionase family DNA binding protein